MVLLANHGHCVSRNASHSSDLIGASSNSGLFLRCFLLVSHDFGSILSPRPGIEVTLVRPFFVLAEVLKQEKQRRIWMQS